MEKEYSEFEKKVIEYIVQNKNNRILSRHVFEKFMDAVALELTNDKKFAIIVTEKSNDDDKYFTKGEKSILEIISIIDYLIENNYIKLFSWGEKIPFTSEIDCYRIFDEEKYQYTPKSIDAKTEILSFDELAQALKAGRYSRNENDKEWVLSPLALQSTGYIYDFFEKHYLSFLLPSHSLINLYNNKFITENQRNFKKQIRDTWFGIGTAMFLGIVGLGLNIYSLFRDNEIPEDQLNSIVNSINETKVAIPDTVKTYIVNDVIKMKGAEQPKQPK